jgi:hypothetical protein
MSSSLMIFPVCPKVSSLDISILFPLKRGFMDLFYIEMFRSYNLRMSQSCYTLMLRCDAVEGSVWFRDIKMLVVNLHKCGSLFELSWKQY